jgi:hypothetical protein
VSPARSLSRLRGRLSSVLSRLGNFFGGALARPAASLPKVPPPEQPKAAPRPVDPRKEYAAAHAGGAYAAYADYLLALPRFQGDIGRAFGDNVYRQMMKDARIRADLETLVSAVLADGLHVRPAVEDKDDPDYGDAKELAEFGEFCLENPSTPVDLCVEEQLLTAAAYGNQAAELVTEEGSGRWAGWDVLGKYKPLPRSSYRMVVNGFGTLVGYRVLRPGEAELPWGGPAPAAALEGVLPTEKFATLVWRPRQADPRGTNLLDACYDPWWHKKQTLAESIKFIARFASPFLFGTTAEGAVAREPVDALGNPTGGAAQDPVQQYNATLVLMQNGGVATAPHGYTLDMMASTSEGRAFFAKIDACDRQITTALHGATRMSSEAEHGSKADSQTGQDVFGLRVKYAKRVAGHMLTGVLYNLVKWNKGKAVADKLAPKVTLNPTEQQDWGERATAAAALGFQVDPSQYPGMDEELNLPPRTPAAALPPDALGALPATPGEPPPVPGLPAPGV